MGNATSADSTRKMSEEHLRDHLRHIVEGLPLDDMDDIIDLLRQILKKIRETPGTSSSSQLGEKLKEHIDTWSPVANIFVDLTKDAPGKVKHPDRVTDHILRALAEALHGLGNVHWLATGLSLLGFVVTRYVEEKGNWKACSHLLQRSTEMVERVHKLHKSRSNTENEADGEWLKEGIALIANCAIVCMQYMKSSRGSRLLHALNMEKDSQDYNAYIDRKYAELLARILETMHSKLENLSINFDKLTCGRQCSQALPEYPTDTVGIKDKVSRMMDKLKLEDEVSVHAIALFGLGGIGKTTLGDAMYAEVVERRLFETGKHCKIVFELEPERNKIPMLQEEICDKLHQKESRSYKIENEQEGRKRLEQHFRGMMHRIFLFMDNVPNEGFLERLLPMKNCLPPGSRILVTARSSNVFRSSGGRQNYLINSSEMHEMECLSVEESRELLQSKLDDWTNAQEDWEQNLNEVSRACCGIPLALEVAAGYINNASGDGNQACKEVVECMKKGMALTGGMDDDWSQVLKWTIDKLSEDSRKAFYDLLILDMAGLNKRCAFKPDYELRLHHGFFWDILNMHIHVGAANLRALMARALVTQEKNKLGCSIFKIQDVVAAAGRSKYLETYGRRVEDAVICSSEELREAIEDGSKDLSHIEALRVDDDKDVNKMVVEAKHVNRMISLSILFLGKSVKVVGKCKLAPSLRYLKLPSLSHIQFDWTRSLAQQRRGLLRGIIVTNESQSLTNVKDFMNKAHDNNMEDLQIILESHPRSMDALQGLQDLQLPPSLKSLVVYHYGSLMALPDFSKLHLLKRLALGGCEHLQGFPNTIIQLPCIERFTNTTCLPQVMSGMCSLRELHVDGCKNLEALSDEIGQLISLEELELTDCMQLTRLPQGISRMCSLRKLRLRGCTKLEALPDEIGKLTSLERLDLQSCMQLTGLPQSISGMCLLRELWLSGCEKLEALPDEIGKLTSLERLDLDNCMHLTRLPQGISGMCSLRELHLWRCTKLEALPDEIGKLTSLEGLKLVGCMQLTGLPQSISGMCLLRELWLYDCEKLEALPDEIGKLTSLEELSLQNSMQLTGLPQSISGMCLLRRLRLNGCVKLEALPDEIGKLTSLEWLDLEGCMQLTGLPQSISGMCLLRQLQLSGCEKLEALPGGIGKLTSLEWLGLEGCMQLTGLPQSISGMCLLRELWLSGCVKLEALPDEIGKLTSLERLSLQNCMAVETITEKHLREFAC